MKLLRMTATFGRLEQETLTLTEGLNVLQLPNEAGKSTWAEFLLAMLYGVDTSEREKTGVLPVKTKYQPWSGKPMAGVIELTHAGRRITITRTSTARAPLGTFSAVYTDSGLPVEGMTGANCGQMLLGVPKSVYQRSAFVRQSGLGLTPDADLEARLSALVTTGDEAVSFAAADKRLLAWQNRVRHNKTGLIPDAERELAAVDGALAALAGEHEKNLSLRAQLQSLQAQQAACEEDLLALRAAETQRKKAQLFEAKRAAMQAANRENAASAVCARLPREDALTALSQEAAALLCLPESEPAAPVPARPACPQAFSGVDEERLLDKAQRDTREFDRLTSKKHRPAAPLWVLAALLTGLGAAGWFLRHEPLVPAAFALAALACALMALINAAHDRRREAELSEAQALLALYENHSRDEFYAYAVQYRDALRAWQTACEAAAAQNAARDAASRLRAERTAALLGSVRMFAEAESLQDAQNAILSALAAYRTWHDAQQTAQQAKTRYDALAQALGELPELPAPARDVSGLTTGQAEAALAQTQALAAAVQSQRDQSRGRPDQFGAEAELSAKKQALAQRLDTLNERREALTLARQTLAQANTALAERFSPRLVHEASEIFSALTGGRYARVQISRQMELEAGQPDAAMRRSLFLSGGTADELYLSVRLAVCRLLLSEDAPLLLDDALAMFDDERLRLALRLLQREAESRQILLFTCQSREKQVLAADV